MKLIKKSVYDMKTIRIVSMGRILIVLLLTLVGATSCSDEEECCTYQEVDGEVREFVNEKGKLRYDSAEGKWKFRRSPETIIFWIGDCEGIDITIVNWDPSFEQYKDGCIVSGTFRQVGLLPYPPERPGAGNHYFEMTIQTISHINPEN